MPDDKLLDENARLAALRRYEIRDGGDSRPFQRIVDLVQQVIGVPAAAVTLVENERQVIKAARGLMPGETPRPEAFCNHTIAQRGPLIVEDATKDERFADNPMVTGTPHIRSYLGVPLTTPDGYNIGSLCAVDMKPRQFDAVQAGILTSLAEIIVEQFELQQIARQDAMTGALTRRGFYAEVEKELMRAGRYNRPSTLVMIDIDRFRMINERYGHAAGDAVLVSLANACMASMRRSDIFGRVGGEEFGLLLPETDAEDAREAAERIRRIVESTIVQVGGTEVRVTASFGVAPVPAASETVAAWFADADVALYEAKQYGRNRVVVSKARRPAVSPGPDRNAPGVQLH